MQRPQAGSSFGGKVSRREWINDLYFVPSRENELACTVACPDHYLLRPSEDGSLEIIETTGGSPFPSRFFFYDGDDADVTVPKDPDYPMQMAGVTRLEDGTVIGAIRHQFKDTPNGFYVTFAIEFPSAMPDYFIREHRMHLACEWTNWVTACFSQS